MEIDWVLNYGLGSFPDFQILQAKSDFQRVLCVLNMHIHGNLCDLMISSMMQLINQYGFPKWRETAASVDWEESKV